MYDTMSNKIKISTKDLSRIIKESIQKEFAANSIDDMDPIIMLKEAYYDLNQYCKEHKDAAYDLAEALGNIRGAIKLLMNSETNR